MLLAVIFLLEPSPRLLFMIVPLMVILVFSIVNALMIIAVTIFAITVVLSPSAGEGRRWRRERNGHQKRSHELGSSMHSVFPPEC